MSEHVGTSATFARPPKSSGTSTEETCETDAEMWDFCLRAWMQAEPLPRGAVKGKTDQSKPGLVRLRAAAVLEQSLQGVQLGSQPTAAQVSTLSGLVKRKEYPIIVEDGSPYRPLADAINLRLAHVLALLAAGRGPSDAAPKHLERLAWAALEVVEERRVKPFSPTAGLCHALRVLDLLWCCAGTADDTFIGHLAGVTGALANGTGVPDKELCPTAASLLSVPLTASLLGLQPLPPPGLPVPSDHATSSALQRVENLDRMAEAWVTSWPKMLWYLGSSYPEFSSFLMSMILQLAKRARPHSLCANLLAAVLPLLVPFIAGARESAPPLARLPLAQPLAAAMVFHFPRLSMRLIQAITSALGRWSSARRTEGDALSDDCCQLLLEAILEDHGRPIDAGELLVPRLQAALALLQMPTESPQGEVSAVKLANVVAAWLMETVSTSTGFQDMDHPVKDHGPADRRHLTFQSLVWPLCQQVCQAGLPSRALCFFYLCARRLSSSRTQVLRDDFWREVFQVFVLKHSALAPSSLPSSWHVLQPFSGEDEKEARHFPALLVAAWMHAAPFGAESASYELLVTLCAQELQQPEGLHAPCAWILVEAAAYRNARTLQRSDAPLLQLRAELQELLNEQKGQRCPILEHLSAALPLL
ncbi:Hypothetical protein SCF082_LOCUS52361 [Durusdinium trenchii]|uniref:Uncharacterized protein n=1 Tax=Durusdinium trenchii TaxID=1381693 RepID=A0ABP0SKL5_9DINO